MEIQKEISCNNNKKLIGHEFDVFIEGKLVDDDVYIGRTYIAVNQYKQTVVKGTRNL